MRFKKILAGVMTFAVAITAAATPVGNMLPLPTVTQEASAASNKYTSSYKTWSQGASAYSGIKNYGCWVVAQAKMLVAMGIASTNVSKFNPDVYYEWEKANGYINSNWNQVNGTKAPVAYSKNQIKYLGETTGDAACKTKIIENAKNGYFTILHGQVKYTQNGTTKTAGHYVLVDNEQTVKNNAIYIFNSYSTNSSAKSGSYKSSNFVKIYNIFTYSPNSAHTHTYGSASYSWSSDCKTCTAARTCTICSTKQTEKATATSSSNYIKTTYTAKFKSSAFAKQTKTVANGSDIGTGFIATIKNKKNSKYLTVNKSTGNVSVAKATGGEDQQFLFTRMSDGTYEIKNILTNKNIDIDNAGTANDTNVQVYKDNNSSAQRFVLNGTASSFTIKLSYANKAVDADGGNSNVHIWTPYSNFAAQTFEITKVTGTSSKFAKPTVSSLTTNNAKIATTAYKNKGAVGKTFAIEVFDKNGDLQTYEFKTGKPNSASNKIDFTLKTECKFTLKTKTKYTYRFKSTYTESGKTKTYYSPLYSFTTK